MSANSKIEWCDATWNCLLGCDKVSQGCTHCYAILQCWMKQHHPNPKIRAAFEGLVEQRSDGSLNWTGKVRELPERLTIPLKWREPRRIFVNSMSDIFHKDVSDDFIAQMFAVAALTPQHQYQFLTKRPERMYHWFTDKRILETTQEYVAFWAEHLPGGPEVIWDSRGSDPNNYIGARGGPRDPKERAAHYAKRRRWPGWPLPNVWLGVSTENQQTADERIPFLLKTPAVVRFLSCEPLIGPIDIRRWINQAWWSANCPVPVECEHGRDVCPICDNVPSPIHWVIGGGESGKGARPLHPDWVRSLRNQCQAARVAFHFKQWGNWLPEYQKGSAEFHSRPKWPTVDVHEFPLARENAFVVRSFNYGKHNAGRMLDGRTWDEFPVKQEVVA